MHKGLAESSQQFTTESDTNQVSNCISIALKHVRLSDPSSYKLELVASFTVCIVTIPRRILRLFRSDWQVEFGIQRGYLEISLIGGQFYDTTCDFVTPLQKSVKSRTSTIHASDSSRSTQEDASQSLKISAVPEISVNERLGGALNESSKFSESREYRNQFAQMHATHELDSASIFFENKESSDCLIGKIEGLIGSFVTPLSKKVKYRSVFTISPSCIVLKNLELGRKCYSNNKIKAFQHEARMLLLADTKGKIVDRIWGRA